MKTIETIYKIGKGPSSSHTMAPVYAMEKYMEVHPDEENILVKLYGSLALTGKGHLTDAAIIEVGEAQNKKVKVQFHATIELPKHENGMEIIGLDKEYKWTVYSIGGGEFTVDEYEITDDSQKEIYPHNSLDVINEYCKLNNLSYLDYIIEFEPNIMTHMEKVWQAMKQSIDNGLNKEGLIPGALQLNRKAKILMEKRESGSEKIGAYAFAVNEENASGGTIVTAPTCGACGTVPALFKFRQDKKNYTDKEMQEALAVAGLFGNVVRTNASISGAEAGCQAEVGTATAMAAAGASFLKGATNKEIEASAEIALEHQLGLTCDPVMGYVQIPCIQRNAVAAVKANLSSRMALGMAEYNIVSFDTIVDVMYETGKDLHVGYRETSQGGLAKYYQKQIEKRELRKDDDEV